MKRQAANHPKMLELADRLDIGRCFAVGIMETLWTWASDYAQDGAITCSPRVLAKSLDYEGDPAALVAALEGAGFLDSDGSAWRIHDWPDHCEDYVHTTLARLGKTFADGTIPKQSKLSTEEREALRRRHETTQKQHTAQNGAERRRTAQNGAGKSTTDTDTDTSLREDIHTYAEPEDQGEEQGPCQDSGSDSADLHADGGPKSVGTLIDAMTGGVRRQEAIEKKAYQIAGITRDGPEYHAYWVEVVKKALSADLLEDLEECLRYASSSTDPAMRAKKDLGEMHSPGKWLVSRMASLFHQKGMRMPRPPRPHGAARATA